MIFRVGQQVICIDNNGAPQLRLNGEYTISEILPFGVYQWRDWEVRCCPVNLLETKAEDHMGGFVPWRFRPATSIAMFKAMLNKAKTDA